MLEQLKQYIAHQHLLAADDKILLTVSGGIDSMVMLHLFGQLGVSTGIAHCNFQLRGNESDEDELFVKTTAQMNGIPFFGIRFETEAYAEENHLSIQMAARDLRYTWFETIRKKQGFTFIATAHNSDDSVETFFINLSRGCGIDGLTGIKPRSGKVIRPLLFASRDMIVQYAKRKGILYREDSSNQTDKYLRNYIRHNVMPVLNEASPNFRKGIQTTLQNLVSSQAIYNEYLEKIKLELITYTNDTVLIHIPALKQSKHISTILWEILSYYQFNRETCAEIAGCLDAQSGKIFLSPTHRLIKDRSQLIITLIPRNETGTYYIESESVPLGLPVKFEMMAEDFNSMELIEKNRNIAMLDLKKVEWPLILRKWKPGDYFAPLGMENLKKVSDFLVDQKLSIHEKENTWVLETGNKIVWIVGHRIDHRFRITDSTSQILKIRYIENKLDNTVNN